MRRELYVVSQPEEERGQNTGKPLKNNTKYIKKSS